jgi:hypothetical protein
LQILKQLRRGGTAAQGGNAPAQRLRKAADAHAIIPDQPDVAERRRHFSSVIELGDRPAEGHAARRVHEQVNAEVFLFDEQFEEHALQTRVRLPVHVAQIVAGRVFPIIGELDARSAFGGALFALHSAGKRPVGHDRQPVQFLQKLGIQQRRERIGNRSGGHVVF